MNRSEDTLKPLQFDKERIELNIAKNTATSYGLTLVAAFPPPPALCDSIQHIQHQSEQLLPQCFTWYARDWLHVTLLALLRGRYRDYPPLQRAELPADVDGFARDLSEMFVQLRPFSLTLSGLTFTRGGLVLVDASDAIQIREQLAHPLRHHTQLDPPQHPEHLHVTIGYCNVPSPFRTDEEQMAFQTGVARIEAADLGTIEVERVWLAHYANRTLSYVIGKVPFGLGGATSLPVDDLLATLGISDTKRIIRQRDG